MVNKVVIVGGGFAGIAAAKQFSNTNFEVVLIDKKNHHLFQPLLYQVASAALSPADISAPIREILSDAKNIRVILDEVTSIDKENNKVICRSNKVLDYDHLILAPGARPSYFGKTKWKNFAPGLKTLEDALTIRNRILKSFEQCELERRDELNFVIVGAGPTGVELAGAFAEIAYDVLLKDFRHFDPSKTKIYLVEGGDHVLPAYKGELSRQAKELLEQLGVIVLANHFVSDIESDHVILSKGDEKIRINSNNVIWAAGNRVSPLIESLNVEIDRMGRAIVNKDLSLKNYPNIYILGDAAHFVGKHQEVLPSLAPVASQQGRHVAKNIIDFKRSGFKYLDKGSMATIGKYKAVMDFHGLKMAGLFAWLSWSIVHVLFLINFRNRFMVFIQWAFALILHRKGVMIITDRENGN